MSAMSALIDAVVAESPFALVAEIALPVARGCKSVAKGAERTFLEPAGGILVGR